MRDGVVVKSFPHSQVQVLLLSAVDVTASFIAPLFYPSAFQTLSNGIVPTSARRLLAAVADVLLIAMSNTGARYSLNASHDLPPVAYYLSNSEALTCTLVELVEPRSLGRDCITTQEIGEGSRRLANASPSIASLMDSARAHLLSITLQNGEDVQVGLDDAARENGRSLAQAQSITDYVRAVSRAVATVSETIVYAKGARIDLIVDVSSTNAVASTWAAAASELAMGRTTLQSFEYVHSLFHAY
jgi:hypothetical protein